MDEEKTPGNIIDKFILGALIGGAIGSVLGVTLAPKSGKENRKTLLKKYKEIKGKILSDRVHGEIKENESQEKIKADKL